MKLRIVVLGLREHAARDGLLRELQRRRHQIIHLAALEAPETAVESLFKNHTGTVRDADLVVVGSDVPARSAVMSWVLDQAVGVVVYYDVDAMKLAPPWLGGTPIRAGRRTPPCDLYLSDTADDSAPLCAVVLERYVDSLLRPAPHRQPALHAGTAI